jgi:AcrR family transcriptional regulator
MSPRTKKQFEVMRKQSMETIREAALELFAKNGFHNTSMNAIAKNAKVSKGLIYNYFESKEALLENIINQAIHTGEEFVQRHFSEPQDPEEMLLSLINGIFAQIKLNPRYFKLLMALSLQDEIMERFEHQIQNHSKKDLDQLIDLFNQLKIPNPRMEAMHFAAILDGVVLHYMYMEDLYPLDEMRDFIIEKTKATIK